MFLLDSQLDEDGKLHCLFKTLNMQYVSGIIPFDQYFLRKLTKKDDINGISRDRIVYGYVYEKGNL